MLVWNPSLLLLLFLFFILSSDTREKVCSCVFKNSPRFFFFVFPFLFLLLFAGHQEKLLNGLGLNISGSGPEENSHSTAPMNDCSKMYTLNSMRWKDMQIFKMQLFWKLLRRMLQKTFNWHQPDNCQECSPLSACIGNLECPISDPKVNSVSTEKWLQLKCT